jgi:hypothetical protein
MISDVPAEREVGQGIERGSHREAVPKCILTPRQILDNGEVVARAHLDPADDVAMFVEGRCAHVGRDAIGDESRCSTVLGGCGVRTVFESEVGRKRQSIPSGSMGGSN